MPEENPKLPASIRAVLAEKGAIPFVEFSELALYDPVDGYYCRDRSRVGASRETDFQTNLAVRSLFAPLVVEAIRSIAGAGDLADFSFVEVAAEPGTSLLAGGEHPFGSAEVVRVLEEVPKLAGPTVLFANEWLDAQPFVRLVFKEGKWQEIFVGLDANGQLTERVGAPSSQDALSLQADLPERAPEGYRFDISLESERILNRYLQADWSGIFLTLDYGSSWEALTRSLPGGTARAYHRHRQMNDLVARPGEQDLTCNVCWDRIASVLSRHGFSVGGPQRQEAFFLEKSAVKIREIVEGGQSTESSGKRARLMQLLNPVHFGAAFQALWGIR